jgi:hypothetical protein
MTLRDRCYEFESGESSCYPCDEFEFYSRDDDDDEIFRCENCTGNRFRVVLLPGQISHLGSGSVDSIIAYILF